MHIRFIAPLVVAAVLAGCSNDLDINADYEDRTIVYGLLNQRDSLHFVKVNKAFLGEGDAYDMALVRDSSEYGDEDITLAEVQRLDGNGNVVETYTLRDTIITDREPGEFYSPVQKLYYFTTPFFQYLPPNNPTTGSRMFLAQDQSYRLRMVIKGKEVLATTPIANDFSISPQDQDTVNSASRLAFINSAGEYLNYSFDWTSKYDDKRFVVSYRFRYDEVTGTDTVRQAFSQQVGTRVSSNSASWEDLSISVNGQAFFSGLSGYIRVNPNWASVERRIFRGMDFLVSVANDDLHTYLTLTEPVSGIIEDRPSYSNLQNALGVWGSRYTKNVIGKRFNGNTLTELVEGPYTSDLHFCSALDPGGAFSCN